MDARLARVAAALPALGTVLSVAASAPSRVYGAPQTGAYLFDPEPLSPLWMERVLVPLLGLLGGTLLVAGLAALVVRDRPVAGRLRRWGGYLAVTGLGLGNVALYVVSTTLEGSQTLGTLLALLVLLVGLVVLLAGLLGQLATGVGYARTDRPLVGYALAAGPVVALLGSGAGMIPGMPEVGVLPLVVPYALTFLAVSYDLWTHHEPLPESTGGDDDRDATTTHHGEAADDQSTGTAGAGTETAEGAIDSNADADGEADQPADAEPASGEADDDGDDEGDFHVEPMDDG